MSHPIKHLLNRVLRPLNQEIRRVERKRKDQEAGAAGANRVDALEDGRARLDRGDPAAFFHSDHYTRHTARRLEHLASLGIDIRGKTVLEFGAGIGDLSTYYIDRGCPITITEARADNLAYLRARFPDQKVLFLDLEKPQLEETMPYQVIHCYGTLYHITNPAAAIGFMARLNSEILFLETRVSFGDAELMDIAEENIKDPTQSFSGKGCRPTRSWLLRELRKHYEHVYIPRTQPNQEEFPIDWTSPETQKAERIRTIFICSRHPIDSPLLSTQLLAQQLRHP